MTDALSGELRSVLERVVQGARLWIEEDLAGALEGRFGIRADGLVESTGSLSLSAEGLAVRGDLVAVVEFLRSEGEDAAGSVERLVREAAFTHTNRLIAVRVAESIGLLPETMGNGLASRGFKDFSELAPTAAATEWGRFGVFVRLCADELAADVPALFDPRNPLLELGLSEKVLARVVDAIAAVSDEVWAAPDALGWAYQFFNTGAERKEMRESSAPRNSRELAVRNQFFTPSYVVEFLVQNGLGAHLAAGFPELADELPLLVEVPTEHIVVDLNTVSVMDPAVGSGHFLLGAYDVLEKAWQLAGVGPAESAPAIVGSLWGIDIDPRCTQIAQAAVIFRARRHCKDLELPKPNVICARALPSGPEIDALIDGLPDHVGRAVRAIATELVNAPLLGPLLKIEERLDQEIRDVFGTGVIEGTLAETATGSTSVEAEVLTALEAIADSATSTATQRLFAAEAHDAVRFVEAMTHRYTAVLMNPPFGEPIASTKPYLKTAYPWAPTKDHNLFALFVGRGLQLSQPDIGTCGAITSRTGLFLKTFEKWRRDVLLSGRLLAAVDLGHGVMEQALVEAIAYVVANQRGDGRGTFIRLLKERNRIEALRESVAAHRVGQGDDRVFNINLAELEAVPGAPVAYWMAAPIRSLFQAFGPLGESGEVKQGLATGDDFRFVRAFWEVDPSRIGTSSEETRQGARWVPFAKGGEYSPYWSDIHLLVDWGNDGELIRGFSGSVVRSPHLYFQQGLTWTLRTASAFGARVLPPGCIFSNKGNIVQTDTPYPVLAWLNSRPVAALLAAQMPAADETTSGGASKSYEVGIIAKLPWPQFGNQQLISLCRELVESRRQEDFSDERTRSFLHPFASRGTEERLDRFIEQIDTALKVERVLFDELRFDKRTAEYLTEEVGPHPGDIPVEHASDNRIEDLYEKSIRQAIEELLSERGGSRVIASLSYVADRRLEVLAQGLRASPKRVAQVVIERGLSEPNRIREQAERTVSYLVGCAFGRWDIRLATSHDRPDIPDHFAPIPVLPPAALGGPATDPNDRRGESYPLDVRFDGLLLDQAGAGNDILPYLEAAASVLSAEIEPRLEQLVTDLGAKTLRNYIRSGFFSDHLARYSMSRRKAPIYWQLQVPSKTWGIWLYAPKLTREMLFAVVRETEHRQHLAEQQITHLQREAESGGGGRKSSEVAKELEAEQKLAVELATFSAEAERIANLGWEPDLDDGMVLNAAPLSELFPAWKEAAKYRDELRAGKYEWATVAQYADQL